MKKKNIYIFAQLTRVAVHSGPASRAGASVGIDSVITGASVLARVTRAFVDVCEW